MVSLSLALTSKQAQQSMGKTNIQCLRLGSSLPLTVVEHLPSFLVFLASQANNQLQRLMPVDFRFACSLPSKFAALSHFVFVFRWLISTYKRLWSCAVWIIICSRGFNIFRAQQGEINNTDTLLFGPVSQRKMTQSDDMHIAFMPTASDVAVFNLRGKLKLHSTVSNASGGVLLRCAEDSLSEKRVNREKTSHLIDLIDLTSLSATDCSLASKECVDDVFPCASFSTSGAKQNSDSFLSVCLDCAHSSGLLCLHPRLTSLSAADCSGM
jgi:hypothetical protein